MSIRKTSLEYPPPFLAKTEISGQELYVSPKQIETFEYYALSDGQRRVYTDKDALPGYGRQMIVDPSMFL